MQETLRATHGIDCDIVLFPQKTTNWHRLWLSASAVKAGDPPLPGAHPAESYGMAVNSSGALIAADSDAGLFYGVETLIQLLEQSQRDKTDVPGMVIEDWPEFGWRARYFDGSQYLGTIVLTRANLEREIKLMARYKLNWFCLELYNLVPFASFPACADANTLSLAGWNYLVELAHRYHVTLVPSLQSFAQMYQVLWQSDAGKPYREATAPGLICPSRPENVQFLQGLYRDLLAVFKYSPVLGIGCSEAGMQWNKKYCPLCRARIEHGETEHDIFCKHARDCVLAVDAAGRELGRPVRPMMWGDEFYMGYNGRRWDGIDLYPDQHHHGPLDVLEGLRHHFRPARTGLRRVLLSATYQHNIYLIDLSPQDPVEGKWEALLDSGIRNVADQARQAVADSSKGLRGKVLGGGCATFSQHDIRCWDTTWFAYALQAEYSWGSPGPLDSELQPFSDKFAAVFYNTRDRQAAQTIASAYRELDAAKSDLERNNYLIRDFIGVYNVQDKSYNGNDLADSLKLIGALPAKTLAEIGQRSRHAIDVAAKFRGELAEAAPRAGNTASMQFLIDAPHRIENHARRTLFLLDLAGAFPKDRLAPSKETAGELLRRCEELQNDTLLLADEMDQLTPPQPDATGYHKALASLQSFHKRLQDAAAK